MYRLKYRKQARNYLARLPLKVKSVIIDRLHQIAADPDHTEFDIKALKGRVGFRLRIGQYRVIYTRHDEYLIMEVVKIVESGKLKHANILSKMNEKSEMYVDGKKPKPKPNSPSK